MKKISRLLIIAVGVFVAVYIAFQPSQNSKTSDKLVFYPDLENSY